MKTPEYYALLDGAPFHVAGDRSIMTKDSQRIATTQPDTPDPTGYAALIRDALNLLAGTPQPWQLPAKDE